MGLGLQVAHDKGADQALIPADFLIGEDQRIVEAHYGSDIKDHLDLERIKHFAAQAEGVRG
ncbi:MAG: hypothetical protein HC842_08120 [Cytophagales bacterium]|nr:hypothetical protein [Cytophagales bacterium]